MSVSNPVIEVGQLKKSFTSHPALKGITFSVNQGEVFGFLGPNGAGKTTTIRSLMQLINPDSGSIKLFGQIINRKKLLFSYTFSFFTVYY